MVVLVDPILYVLQYTCIFIIESVDSISRDGSDVTYT